MKFFLVALAVISLSFFILMGTGNETFKEALEAIPETLKAFVLIIGMLSPAIAMGVAGILSQEEG